METRSKQNSLQPKFDLAAAEIYCSSSTSISGTIINLSTTDPRVGSGESMGDSAVYETLIVLEEERKLYQMFKQQRSDHIEDLVRRLRDCFRPAPGNLKRY